MLKKRINRLLSYIIRKIYPTDILSATLLNTDQQQKTFLELIDSTEEDNIFYNKNVLADSYIDNKTKLYSPYKINHSTIEAHSYIAGNSMMSYTTVGKFCSIGPNFISGWGIHPTEGISTSPMFYSTHKQNGITISEVDKIEERKPIHIGNDVFIGMNVTILDGVTIGDGAVIGAGSIVSKDIPPYAIAFGNPIQIRKYRFEKDIVDKLLEIKWWNWDTEQLKEIEQMFFNINEFVEKYHNEKLSK